MSLPEVFGSRLKLLLERNKMTEKELGKKIFCNQQTISHYVRGVNLPRYEMIVQIADIFDTSLDYLLGRSDIYAYDKENLEVELIQLLNRIFLAYGFEIERRNSRRVINNRKEDK